MVISKTDGIRASGSGRPAWRLVICVPRMASNRMRIGVASSEELRVQLPERLAQLEEHQAITLAVAGSTPAPQTPEKGFQQRSGRSGVRAALGLRLDLARPRGGSVGASGLACAQRKNHSEAPAALPLLGGRRSRVRPYGVRCDSAGNSTAVNGVPRGFGVTLGRLASKSMKKN